ncbi:hypothetical protein HCH_02320 [Hahella chejuensis KCTC 2396]|uniref:Uncharacterized protein n=1 Tax=Hahella chejuensis (strain KCTC 2396) TaxID=349521 RepID=Q2SJN1_HAHCH|nr:hypothetical protein HCH_02320 [Hahella chejuensis KCTC 2396]
MIKDALFHKTSLASLIASSWALTDSRFLQSTDGQYRRFFDHSDDWV